MPRVTHTACRPVMIGVTEKHSTAEACSVVVFQLPCSSQSGDAGSLPSDVLARIHLCLCFLCLPDVGPVGL